MMRQTALALPAMLLALALAGCSGGPGPQSSIPPQEEPVRVASAAPEEDPTPQPALVEADEPTEPIVEIWIETDAADGLGAYALTLRFDPEVAVIEEVLPGDSPFSARPTSYPPFYLTGEVRIAGFHIEDVGVTGTFRVARVRFVAAGGGELRPVLDLHRLYSPRGVPIEGRAELRPANLPVFREP